MPGSKTKAGYTRSDDRYVGIPEAAAYLGVSVRTIRNMLSDGRLPAKKLGARVVRIKKSDIDAALQDWT